LDIREIGAPTPDGNPQTSSRRLFLQLHAFAGSPQPEALVEALSASSLESVLYEDLNDPTGVAVLLIAKDPADVVVESRELFVSHPFSELRPKPELTMIGRTYSTGREPDLEDWLLVKPRRNVLNPALRWAIWYPLRRKPEFYLLPPPDQGKILAEHGMMGRAYAEAGYANDIRLACFGLDQRDNEFVIGLVGAELYPLSRLVQDMRKTQQTAKYIDSLGPFFVGQVCWQSPMRAD
jgi:chlorite dismutase